MDDGLNVEGQEEAEQGAPEDSHPEESAAAATDSAAADATAADADAAVEDAKLAAAVEDTERTAQTDAECNRLLARYEAVGHALAAFGHPHRPLLQAVELVEALLQDFEQRATVEVEADEIAASQRRMRQPHLIKQLTFYFSDANLRHDKFLRQKIEEDATGQGYAEIGLILSFNRVKQIGCTTEDEMAAAVEAAPASAGLELSAQRDRIRRQGGAPFPPLTSIGNSESPSLRDQCTIRIERLPKVDSVDADEVRKLCASYGEVVHVWLVHTSKGEREFTGVAEVEFRTKDAADAATVAQPPLEWSGSSLLVKSLIEFRAERSEQRGAKRPLCNDEANESAKRARIEKEAVDSAARFNRGVVLRLDDVPSAVTWMDIKDAFSEYGEVVYVDTEVQNKGHRAYVRMRDTEGAAAAIKGLASSGGFLWFELPAEEEDDAATKTNSNDDKKGTPPAASLPEKAAAEDKAAEDPSAAPTTDPYGGEADEPAAVSKSDPYGGGEEAGSAADDKTADAAEADPFVVDTEGSAVVDAKEDNATKEDNAAEKDVPASDDAAEKTQTFRVAVVQLAGDEEEAYIQRMALALAERRAKKAGKGGKEGKDRREKSGKGGKGAKEGKGSKGKKGGKDGKRKSGKKAKGGDSDSE